MEDYNTQVVARCKAEYYKAVRLVEQYKREDPVYMSDEHKDALARVKVLEYVLDKGVVNG